MVRRDWIISMRVIVLISKAGLLLQILLGIG
jgi:hypothetical protein